MRFRRRGFSRSRRGSRRGRSRRSFTGMRRAGFGRRALRIGHRM